MCFQVRASTRSLPFTWQWLAAVDWIPYDAPSNEQLEAAFQAGQAKAELSRGWFASKRGEYTVHFGRRPAKVAKAERGSGASAAAASARREEADADDGGSDAEEEEEGEGEGEERAASASGSFGGAGVSAGSAAPASATVPAYTQVNNHSRMVRKVRRVSDNRNAHSDCDRAPGRSRQLEHRLDEEPHAALLLEVISLLAPEIPQSSDLPGSDSLTRPLTSDLLPSALLSAGRRRR